MEQNPKDLRTGLITNKPSGYPNLMEDGFFGNFNRGQDQPQDDKEFRYAKLESDDLDQSLQHNTWNQENKPMNQNHQPGSPNARPSNNMQNNYPSRPPTDATFSNQNQAPPRNVAPVNNNQGPAQPGRDDLEACTCNACGKKVLIPKVAVLFKCVFCQNVCDKRVQQQRPMTQPQQARPQLYPQFQPPMQQQQPQYQAQQRPQTQQQQYQTQSQPQFRQPLTAQGPIPKKIIVPHHPGPNKKFCVCGKCRMVLQYEATTNYVRCVCGIVNYIP